MKTSLTPIGALRDQPLSPSMMPIWVVPPCAWATNATTTTPGKPSTATHHNSTSVKLNVSHNLNTVKPEITTTSE